jgi:hypothetical protein
LYINNPTVKSPVDGVSFEKWFERKSFISYASKSLCSFYGINSNL